MRLNLAVIISSTLYVAYLRFMLGADLVQNELFALPLAFPIYYGLSWAMMRVEMALVSRKR